MTQKDKNLDKVSLHKLKTLSNEKLILRNK